MKKQLPTVGITSELAQSVFFAKAGPEPLPEQTDGSAQATPAALPPPQDAHDNQKDSDASQQDVKPDVMIDVMTSQVQTIPLKQWQEIIENTETQNSALRLTTEERYAIEDVINELRRKYGIKTSMNEVARLGLLLLIHDFKQHKKQSMIHKMKKA